MLKSGCNLFSAMIPAETLCLRKIMPNYLIDMILTSIDTIAGCLNCVDPPFQIVAINELNETSLGNFDHRTGVRTDTHITCEHTFQ